jgi:hypothetical protein
VFSSFVCTSWLISCSGEAYWTVLRNNLILPLFPFVVRLKLVLLLVFQRLALVIVPAGRLLAVFPLAQHLRVGLRGLVALGERVVALVLDVGGVGGVGEDLELSLGVCAAHIFSV